MKTRLQALGIATAMAIPMVMTAVPAPAVVTTQTTTETFMQKTQLSRFSNNPAGLSPREFLTRTFEDVDRDGSGGIQRAEWRDAYIFNIAPVPVQGNIYTP